MNRIITSLIYKFIERCGYQAIAFVIQVILARILDPTEYGVLAILMIFISISQVLVQSGLNTALIQSKETDERDFTSVFYLSLGIAVILYGILWFYAPAIAKFYAMPEVCGALRVMALILIPGAFNSVQNAIIAREMKFKLLMYGTLGAVVISGVVGIGMAYMGYGVWALVAQQLVNQMTICAILWFVIKWRPKRCAPRIRVKVLFGFGWKLLLSGLLDTVYSNLSGLVIGKKYASDMLGYCNRGKQFPDVIVSNINGSLQTVMLPVLSSKQDDKERVKALMRRFISVGSFIVMPLIVGLAAMAKPLVSMLLTDKWLPCVPFLQIYCITYAFYPMQTANLQAINAQGRSDIFLKLEIIKKAYGIAVLAIAVFCFNSVIAIAFSGTVATLISCFVNAYPNKRLLQYGYIEQAKDILPSLGLSILMGVVVYAVQYLNLSNALTLALQILLGMAFYAGMSRALNMASEKYLEETLRYYLKGKQNGKAASTGWF